ncbi:MAG: NHL repeat-containing protein [Candidatus Acidiferrales bacterium]
MKIAVLLCASILIVACSSPHSLVLKRLSDRPALEYAGAWGTLGEDPGKLQNPVAMAVDRVGNIFLADLRKGSTLIHKYNPHGHPLLSFYVDGCQHPSSIAIDWGGAIYLADRHTGTIYVYMPDGMFMKTIRHSAGRSLQDPASLAVGFGGQLFILESSANRVLKLDWLGRELKSWGSKGSEPGQFDLPSKVALADDGSLYIADPGNRRVQKFSSDGDFIAQWPLAASDSLAQQGFDPEYSIAASDKLVVAAQSGYGQMEFWTSDGKPKASVNDLLVRATLTPPLAQDVALTPKGELLLLDSTGSAPRILRFRVNF